MLLARSCSPLLAFLLFFFTDTPTTDIYTLSLHDALPISLDGAVRRQQHDRDVGVVLPDLLQELEAGRLREPRSEEHTSELQSHSDLVCRLLLEKKKQPTSRMDIRNTDRSMLARTGSRSGT